MTARIFIQFFLKGLLGAGFIYIVGKSATWFWGGKIKSKLANKLLNFLYTKRPEPSRLGQQAGLVIVYEAYI